MAERPDPRTPCLVGWSQHTWPRSSGLDAPEPLAMWEQVSRAAAESAGASVDPLGHVDSTQLVHCMSWTYDDPVGRLSERLGTDPRHRACSSVSGTSPMVLVRDAATAIEAGDVDVALVASGEALATKKRLRAQGERPAWSHRDPERRPMPFDAPFPPAEVAHEVFAAWLTFALFDTARRAHLGVGLEEHRADLARLWHRFSTVAAANPHAWFPVERSVEEILTVTPANRMVGDPYSKYMVAVMDVDMAAALILTSHEKADALGVPADQRVYLRGWCAASDPVAVAAHRDMWRSPAMAAASREALGRADVGIDDVAHLDLYSCFASSVDFARDALGLADTDPRPLTVTGGLPSFGGPGSGYMTHSLASMADTLRADPGSVGLVSGVGMHMTRHVYGVLSTTPAPLSPPDEAGVQAALDAEPAPEVADTHEGPATVAACCIAHDAEGPTRGVLVVDLPDARRAYARVTDPDLMADAGSREVVGAPVTLATDGTANTATW